MGQNNQPGAALELEPRIRQELAGRKDSDILELAPLTTFDWDMVYVFGENSSAAAINRALGVEWMQEDDFYVEELTDLLVFTKQGAVVGHSTITGDLFVPGPGTNVLARGSDRFLVRVVEDRNRPVVLIPQS